jgi:hypothetical protein
MSTSKDSNVNWLRASGEILQRDIFIQLPKGNPHNDYDFDMYYYVEEIAIHRDGKTKEIIEESSTVLLVTESGAKKVLTFKELWDWFFLIDEIDAKAEIDPDDIVRPGNLRTLETGKPSKNTKSYNLNN